MGKTIRKDGIRVDIYYEPDLLTPFSSMADLFDIERPKIL